MKKFVIHFLIHIEKYQLIFIGILALIWNLYPNSKHLEPLIVITTVIFAAFALKKIIIKGNVDEELKRTIANSHPVDDWYTNETFSENQHIAVYRKDPAIKIIQFTEPVVKNFQEPWLKGLYPDPNAHSYKVSIQYNNNELIERIIISVDGGRARIPLPKSATDLTTNQFDLSICQILDGSTAYDTAYYFSRTKIKLEKELFDNEKA